jgi:peptide chain release factor 2
LRRPSKASGGIFDWDALNVKVAELDKSAEDPELWSNQEKAQALLKERTYVRHMIDTYHRMDQEKSDALTLLELAQEEGDAATLKEAGGLLAKVASEIKALELESLLSGEADGNNCFIEIHSGAGGTESQDWAFMLFRMYVRWAERRGFRVDILEQQAGEEAGIKSATIKISGMNAYGWAKTESGVHRLVRISPFDSNARRHTSFSSAWVYPEVDDTIEIEIEEKDLRIDTFRASGAGGQHVNKTDSAVRITHIPTNIAVACQNQRSQHQNKAAAMKILQSRLYELELQKREAEADAINASKTDNGWGHQIRSYVLQPYQMVKDLRTNVETSNTQAVLDGDIDLFINAALSARVGAGASGA